jgi:hypothetical protein
MTVGDAIMRDFKLASALDYAGEKMVQYMLSVRALVNPLDSLQLIQAQAKNDGLIRQQTIGRLRTARAFLASDQPAMRNAQTESMRRAWEDFKKSEKAPTAIKDVRAALLVMIIEGVNFSKMAHACIEKGDAKSWWGLVASGMTITSGLFDVAGGILKNMTQNAKGEFDKGASLWSYQRLKLFGGVLSSATAAIGMVFDVEDMFKSHAEGQKLVTILFGAKALLGGVSAALSVATALTYSSPFLKNLVSRSVVALSARVTTSVGGEIVAARILLMSAGVWVSLAIFSMQVLIWIFSDDELQKWCALCIFGEDHNAQGAYHKLSEQNDGLNMALIAIGMTSSVPSKTSDDFRNRDPKPTIEEMKMYD